MKKIQVLQIGAGGYGARYLDELLKSKTGINDCSYELAGVADPFAASSRHFDELKVCSVPIYNSPDEFYYEKRADLAVIVSPIHTHAEYIRTCLKNGSNVLSEKPVTGSLEEHDRLIELERESCLFVAVGFQDCFSPDVLALKQDILGGLLGSPLYFKLLRLNGRGTKYYNRNVWAGKISLQVEKIFDSPLQNAHAHDLQNMFFLLGDEMDSSVKLESAEAKLWQGNPYIENYNAVAVRFITSRGVDVFFYTAHCTDEDMPAPLAEYHFDKAVVKWQDWGITAHFNDGTIKRYSEGRVNSLQSFYSALEAVITGSTPACTLKTARSHTHSVNLVQEFPIIKIPRENLIESDAERSKAISPGGTYFTIPGLGEALIRSYEEKTLPSEDGISNIISH